MGGPPLQAFASFCPLCCELASAAPGMRPNTPEMDGVSTPSPMTMAVASMTTTSSETWMVHATPHACTSQLHCQLVHGANTAAAAKGCCCRRWLLLQARRLAHPPAQPCCAGKGAASTRLRPSARSSSGRWRCCLATGKAPCFWWPAHSSGRSSIVARACQCLGASGAADAARLRAAAAGCRASSTINTSAVCNTSCHQRQLHWRCAPASQLAAPGHML